MKTIRFALGPFVFLALFAGASQAQIRTFVSGLGDDANPCSRLAPCRTFQVAVNTVTAGGEVVALDSAGYGTFAVFNKTLTVEAPDGVYAGITVPAGGTDGILIGGGASDVVTFKGVKSKDVEFREFRHSVPERSGAAR
jgi:hypothetical protein